MVAGVGKPLALSAAHVQTSSGADCEKSFFLEPGVQTARTSRDKATDSFRSQLHPAERHGEQCRGMRGVIHAAGS